MRMLMAALLANCPPDSLEECCDAVTDVLGITGDTSDDATLLLAQVQSIPVDRKAHWQLDAHPSRTIVVRHDLSPRQVETLLAGGILRRRRDDDAESGGRRNRDPRHRGAEERV